MNSEGQKVTVEIISLKEMPAEIKILLLKELGYNSDGKYVIDNSGNKHVDKYTEEPIEISNMAIFPGSTIILDNNPLSIASYLEEYKIDV
jgi:hypothetical protein